MHKLLQFFFITLLCACIRAQDTPTTSASTGTCGASVTITKRDGASWVSEGVEFSIYDIVAQNTGTCAIYILQLEFDSAFNITDFWNYQPSGFNYFAGVVSVPPSFNDGQAFNGAGFILPSPNTVTGVIVTANCEAPCNSVTTTGFSGEAPVTRSATPNEVRNAARNAARHASRSAARTAVRAATADLAANETAPTGICSASVTVTQRLGASYVSNGVENNIYDIVAQNTGTCNIYVLQFEFADGVNITNSWNYQPRGYYYFAGVISIPPSYFNDGVMYDGAGFILPASNSITDIYITANCGDPCNSVNTTHFADLTALSAAPTPAAPTSAAPTTAPTVAAPTVAAPTTSPIGNNGCGAGLEINIIVDSTWNDDGTTYQGINIIILNNGQSTIKGLTLSIKTSHGATIAYSDVWSLSPISGDNYEVSLYGNTLTPGTSLNAPGMTLTGGDSLAISVFSAHC